MRRVCRGEGGGGDGYLLSLHVQITKCPFMAVPMYNVFKFRVSFRVSIKFRVKLDYIRFDLVRLKVLFTRLTPGAYMQLDVEG